MIKTTYSKSSLGNVQYQYLPELLVNVHVQQSRVDKKSVLLCVWKLAFVKSIFAWLSGYLYNVVTRFSIVKKFKG